MRFNNLLKICAASSFEFEFILDSLEVHLAEVGLGISLTDKIRRMAFATKNFISAIQREVAVAAHLRLMSANEANAQLMSALMASQNAEELASNTSHQEVQLRKIADLLESTLNVSSTSAAIEEQLQRVKVEHAVYTSIMMGTSTSV